MRMTTVCIIGTIAFGAGCSSANSGSDGGLNNPLVDGGSSCPALQPGDNSACTEVTSCYYGHATCCGIESSAFTCQCEHGAFQCAQTVECNFSCPDAGH
jgi:hypothetical protein